MKSVCILICIATLTGGCIDRYKQAQTSTENNDLSPEVTPISPELRSEFGLDVFYQKVIDSDGFPIVASGKVSDMAMKEAAYLINHMLTDRGDIRQALIKNKMKFVVMATDEFTTDVPEHKTLTPGDFWDRRARGLGATKDRPTVSCGEENLLCSPGDPYKAENILIHEFAHTLHQFGLNYVDPTFDDHLKALYDESLAKGLWKDTYAGSNYLEYWAEGVQSWFETNTENDAVHNHINTRKELIEYDPKLAELIGSVFRDHDWHYTRPYDRANEGHLINYNAESLRTFVWPERLKDAEKAVTKVRDDISGKSRDESEQ